MIKSNIAVALLTLLAASTAWAEPYWILPSTSGEVWFANKDSVVKNGNKVQLDIEVHFKTPMVVDGKPLTHAELRNEYDCAAKTLHTIKGTAFDTRDTAIDFVGKGVPSAVNPDTIQAEHLALICGGFQKSDIAGPMPAPGDKAHVAATVVMWRAK